MTSFNGCGTDAVYKRTDPAQCAVRKDLSALDDTELAQLEADILAFTNHGVETPLVARLIAVSAGALQALAGPRRLVA